MTGLVDVIKRLTTVHTGDVLRDTRGSALLWLLLSLNVLNVIYGAIILPGVKQKLIVLGLLAMAQSIYVGMLAIARSGRIDGAAFSTGLIISTLILTPIPYLGATSSQIITLFAPLVLVGFCARPLFSWLLLAAQCGMMGAIAAFTPAEKMGPLSTEMMFVAICALLMIAIATTLNDRFQRKLVHRLLDLNHNLEDAREAAEQSNTAKSLFLATMSHELRTPLSTIMGYTDLVCENVEEGDLDGEQIVSDLAFVKHAGGHLLKLIDDVLDLSRVESGQMVLEYEPIDLYDMLEMLAIEVAPAMRDNHNRLDVQHMYEVVDFVSDRRRVRQILLNLLSNAAKFTHEGEVTLSVSKVRMQRAKQDDFVDAIRFDVLDTGVGLAEEDHARIFERFEQADTSTTRAYGGTGLGLALSANLASALGGEITLASAPGEGSCFSLTIPVKPLDAAV